MRTLIDVLTRNWALKLTAVVLATLFWTINKEDRSFEVNDIPIEVVLQDPEWTLVSPPAPAMATVVFSGPMAELLRLGIDRPRIILVVDEVRDSTEFHPLQSRWVQVDADLRKTRVESVRPGNVLLSFERMTTRLLPVSVRTRGELPPGLALDGRPRPEPQDVRVSGPASRLQALDSVRLAPIELGDLHGPSIVRTVVDTVSMGGLIFSPRQVDVHVPVVPGESELEADAL